MYNYIIYPDIETYNQLIGSFHEKGLNFKKVKSDDKDLLVVESSEQLNLADRCLKVLEIKNDYVYDNGVNLGRFTKERGHRGLFTYKNQSYGVIDIPFS